MSKVKNLDDVLPKELKEAASKPLEDYFDRPLVFYACREVTGTNGVYMRIVVSLPESDEQFFLSTGASQVLEIMNYLKENKLFPVSGMFTKAGRAIILKGA